MRINSKTIPLPHVTYSLCDHKSLVLVEFSKFMKYDKRKSIKAQTGIEIL